MASTRKASRKTSLEPNSSIPRRRRISELVKMAKMEFDPKLPIKAYIKSAAMLYQQATALLAENEPQVELAFIYLVRASTIIINDLPSKHSDYPLLPPTFKGLLQADGKMYMDALVPLKAKLANNQSQPPTNLSPNCSNSTDVLSTPPTSSSSPQSSIATPDKLHSCSSRTRPISKQHSSPATSSSNPSHYRSPIGLRKYSDHSSLDHGGDWELVEQPTSPLCHPARLHKKPPSRAPRAPEEWPVELGGGQGTRMSVALPPANAGPDVLPTVFPLSRAQSAAFHYARHPPPTTGHPSSAPRLRPPLSSSSRSTRDSQRLSEAHSDTQRTLSRDIPQAPWISSPTSSVHPSLGSKSLRMTMSTDNLSHDHRPTSDPRSPPLSSFKALISRPRRTSLTTPPKLPLKPSPQSSPVPHSPEPSPLGSSMQPRVRRGSYDPTTWRWLMALAPKLSAHHPPSELNHTPQQNDLYAEPGATIAKDVLVQPLRDFSIAPSPSSSDQRRPLCSSRTVAPKKLSSHSLSAVSKRGHSASAPALVPLSLSQPSAPPLPPPVPPKEPGMRFKSDKGALKRADGLRKMVCPDELVGTFMEIARPETERGVELCGLLLGKLVGEDELVVTTLMVPKQMSKPDSCATTDEEEVFEYQTKWGLMTLGWIHTHPTQTCFMSSVDLHTHCSYQLMLPEAVAIVCSPNKEPCVGVFRLTDPPGIQIIRNCREESSSTFHVHPAGVPIYTDADAGDGEGHFIMKKTMELEFRSGNSSRRQALEIIDLRQV